MVRCSLWLRILFTNALDEACLHAFGQAQKHLGLSREERWQLGDFNALRDNWLLAAQALEPLAGNLPRWIDAARRDPLQRRALFVRVERESRHGLYFPAWFASGQTWPNGWMFEPLDATLRPSLFYPDGEEIGNPQNEVSRDEQPQDEAAHASAPPAGQISRALSPATSWVEGDPHRERSASSVSSIVEIPRPASREESSPAYSPVAGSPRGSSRENSTPPPLVGREVSRQSSVASPSMPPLMDRPDSPGAVSVVPSLEEIDPPSGTGHASSLLRASVLDTEVGSSRGQKRRRVSESLDEVILNGVVYRRLGPAA